MKKGLLFVVILLAMSFVGWGQTTVSYDFSASGAVSGLNQSSPGITLDANIGFGSFKNSGTSNPVINSGQLRLYQNSTKGGSIKVYASNGVTITEVVVYASVKTGPAAYSVNGTGNTALTINSGSYTMSSLAATSEVEFWCTGSSSTTRIYVDRFEVTYTSAAASGPAITNIVQSPSTVDNTNTVSVSANVTDGDGVAGVELHWGTVMGGAYPNTISMSNIGGSTYTTDSDIPVQTTGTTIYYEIYALDNNLDETTSPEQSYTVQTPATPVVAVINEFEWNELGSDTDEFIEVFIENPQPGDLSQFSIVEYESSDGSAGLTQGTHYLDDFTAAAGTNLAGTAGVFYYLAESFENDDAVALCGPNGLIEFIHTGSMVTASSGCASGNSSTSIGVSSGYDIGSSAQRQVDNSFAIAPETPGAINADALPVELTTFTATKKAQTTYLQWQTATEINNDYMAIERSSNGRDFEEITRVKGAGTTYEAQSYEYTDAAPLAGVNYYRLRQVDFDGKATLHNTVSVTFDKGEGVVRIIPTEAASEVMVYLPEQLRQTAQLRLYDLTGQLWMNQTLNRGTQERQLDVSALPQGHYFLQLIDGNAVETVRFNKI